MTENLTPKLEDYLEAIYRIERKKRVARPVTAALQSLAEKKLINYQPYEVVTLTDDGRRKAEQIFARRLIVGDFLREVLGLEARQASRTACDMEHAIDTEVLQRFVCFLAFLKRRSRLSIAPHHDQQQTEEDVPSGPERACHHQEAFA